MEKTEIKKTIMKNKYAAFLGYEILKSAITCTCR